MNTFKWRDRSLAAETVLAILLHFVLAAWMLGANPFAGQTVGPFDLLASQPAWKHEVPPIALRNGERSDVLDALLPHWLYARKALREHRLPIWNPLPGGGERGIQNLASAELTPAFVLFSVSPTPALGFYLATLFNLGMIGCGGYLWLRRRLAFMPAVFGGVSLMLCGFHAAWLYWPHTMTSMWICWLLWAIDRWWARPGYMRFLGISGYGGLLLLGGFPFVTLLGSGSAGLYVICLLWRDPQPHWRTRAAGPVLALMVSAALCAVPLISFAQWLSSKDLSQRFAGSAFHLFGGLRLLLPQVAKTQPEVESTIYAGTLTLVFAAVAWLFVLGRRWRVSVTGLFSFLLGVVGFVLVFEIIPAQDLAWVPGLSNNLWSRASIILDLALITAAAYALNGLRKHLRSPAVATGLTLLFLVYQVSDLGRLFSLFNGPVANTYFYPPTPLITRVKDNIRPFQSVIADSNFLISGTLGAYGIDEWFAHSFKSPAIRPTLMQIATNPFNTPTSTRIEGSSYHLANPMMGALGIRYALGGPALLQAQMVPYFDSHAAPAGKKALPPMPGHQWVQHFELTKPQRLSSISLRLATYARTQLRGTVVLRLLEDVRPAVPVAEIRRSAAGIADNQLAVFALPQAIDLAPGRYNFTLFYEDAGKNERVTAWYTPGNGRNCSLLVDTTPITGCLDMVLTTVRHDMGPFVPVASAHDIYLLENTDVPSGPYFLPSLKAMPHRHSSGSVELERFTDAHFDLSYRGNAAGFVVVPMIFARGWKATLDGKPVTPRRYLGELPAIPVSGPARLVFRFSPDSLRYGPWVSLIALIGLLLYPAIRRVRSGPAKELA